MDKARATRAIVTVGVGRGFIVSDDYVITAGHCLRKLPPSIVHSALTERTYKRLLGSIWEEPTVWTECLFVDPIADIAVLGTPDSGAFPRQAEKYEELMDSAVPLSIADSPINGKAWLSSLDSKWFSCSAKRAGHMLHVSKAMKGIVGGMSGSPIIADDGSAFGVICTSSGGSDEMHNTGSPNAAWWCCEFIKCLQVRGSCWTKPRGEPLVEYTGSKPPSVTDFGCGYLSAACLNFQCFPVNPEQIRRFFQC